MEIIGLDPENISDYEDIIDRDVSENIGREFYRGIVAEDDSSSSGALIWEYKNLEDSVDTDAEIVFISSESKEMTDELLLEFNDQASDKDVVRCFFEAEELRDHVKNGFSDDGFTLSTCESRDLIVKISDLYSLAAPKKKVSPKIMGLSEIMEIQFMQGVTNCMFHGKKGIIEDLEYIDKDWFDGSVSACTITDGKVSGLFLVHRLPSGNLIPVLLNAIGPDANNDNLNMLRFSARKAMENYPGETRVIIRRHNEMVGALAKKLFGDKSGGQVVRGERSSPYDRIYAGRDIFYNYHCGSPYRQSPSEKTGYRRIK